MKLYAVTAKVTARVVIARRAETPDAAASMVSAELCDGRVDVWDNAEDMTVTVTDVEVEES